MDVLQRGELARPFPASTAIPFHLILSGPYIELELGGEVAIATLSGERLSGRIGIWTESGRIRLDDLTVVPLRPIVHG